jgi:hypothetical protein
MIAQLNFYYVKEKQKGRERERAIIDCVNPGIGAVKSLLGACPRIS